MCGINGLVYKNKSPEVAEIMKMNEFITLTSHYDDHTII